MAQLCWRQLWWNSVLYLIGHCTSVTSGQVYTPQEVIINSGRPTFYDPSTSISGKIALEEHVGNSLLWVILAFVGDNSGH